MSEVEIGDFKKRAITDENRLLSMDITFDDNYPSQQHQPNSSN